jgi:hypothetical protein
MIRTQMGLHNRCENGRSAWCLRRLVRYHPATTTVRVTAPNRNSYLKGCCLLRFEIFTAVKVSMSTFWVLTSCEVSGKHVASIFRVFIYYSHPSCIDPSLSTCPGNIPPQSSGCFLIIFLPPALNPACLRASAPYLV